MEIPEPDEFQPIIEWEESYMFKEYQAIKGAIPDMLKEARENGDQFLYIEAEFNVLCWIRQDFLTNGWKNVVVEPVVFPRRVVNDKTNEIELIGECYKGEEFGYMKTRLIVPLFRVMKKVRKVKKIQFKTPEAIVMQSRQTFFSRIWSWVTW